MAWTHELCVEIGVAQCCSRAANEQHAADAGQRVQKRLRNGVYLFRQLPRRRHDDGAHLRLTNEF